MSLSANGNSSAGQNGCPFPADARLFPARCMTRCVDSGTAASDFGGRVGATVGKGVGFSGSKTDSAL